jgi:hypothetical protein
VSQLIRNPKERVCDICVLSSRSSESERLSFCERFPYWRDSSAGILNDADGEETAFVSFGSRLPSKETLLSIEQRGVTKWLVANSYDEWSEEFTAFADSRSSPVEWLLPGWPESIRESDGSYLLFIGDEATDPVLLETFVIEGIGSLRGIPVRVLDLRNETLWSDALDAVSNAAYCVSLLGDRQIEHWLYKAALRSGCESWISVGDNLLDARYLGDSNRNRISVGIALVSKLRTFVETIAGLAWEGRLEAGAYDDCGQFGSDFNRWLRTDALRAMDHANSLLPREAKSGFDFGGVSLARSSASIIATLGGNGDAETLAPLISLNADGRRGFFDELMPRRYCSEWAEVFLYRSFRDKEWLHYSLDKLKRGIGFSNESGQRASVKVGRALLEQARLSVFGYDEELPKEAFTLLLEGVGSNGHALDLVGGLGLASVLAGEEARIDEFANAYLSHSPGAADFFIPIVEHLIIEGSLEKAMFYIDCEIEANGMSDRALMLKIDLYCRLGKLEPSLELVHCLNDETSGLFLVATAPFRLAHGWDLKGNSFSDDELKECIKIADRIRNPDPFLSRAKGVYASRLGLWDRAEESFRCFLSGNRNSGSAIGQLRLDLARLEVAPSHFNIDGIGGTDWVQSLDQSLIFAITVALDGQVAGIADLKALISSDNGLARQGGSCSLDEVNALRCYALMLMELLGFSDEQELLARRLLPKLGRPLNITRIALSEDRMATILEIKKDASELCSRAKTFLEPRFLDV